jgi:hypothetical protein
VDDEELVSRIEHLVREEHQLERQHAGEGLSETERERMQGLEVRLDECWDLLRQRRARRAVGLDPDSASERPAEVVEGYEQ